ncbi:MAG TPA: rhodanese-like domain-containing protein [Thermodesulfobacteriota bacterium]|nr:rhodanese-like domain-containing protein [Thermodesulfobacteriota bacterium]HNU70238.1 rhodanese-like domain-containing protein [Thermodesulfobacteriota bacterium]HQO77517.1 rhodanese-like domain-containing protein [Thermodesulfobacteriota bacterium]
MKRKLVERGVVLALLLGIVAAMNSLQAGEPSSMSGKTAPPPAASLTPAKSAPRVLSLAAFQEALKRPGTIILDARSANAFSRGHIPEARNLRCREFGKKSAQVLKGVPFDAEIITYCSSVSCPSAEKLASLLKGKGYTNVGIFFGGWKEWITNNLPIE